ncbi:MAG TPA: DUF455 domain-containing protein [Gammaproteobacteria bacterium]|nr:DUF455 domain-containing protein [Gammaproteobacteria bacterium]HAU06651.1 DUF455 domain-containing protein [Gammaproteobacteria bacterium]
MKSLRQQALSCLLLTDPKEKVTATQQLYADWQAKKLQFDHVALVVPDNPGRPDKPELVSPKALPRRRNSKKEGIAPLIHAITHIEFNAINLALDAIARFPNLPEAYYTDWLQVAKEEAYHYSLLQQHLTTLGYDYGAFPAHNGMWEMAIKTHHDPLIRMALVPRVLEARGLDVTPQMIDKLNQAGDEKAAAILAIILRDEIGHVAIGTRWFNYLCQQRKLDSLAIFQTLLDDYFDGQLRGPFHIAARQQAGFSQQELALIQNQASH